MAVKSVNCGSRRPKSRNRVNQRPKFPNPQQIPPPSRSRLQIPPILSPTDTTLTTVSLLRPLLNLSNNQTHGTTATARLKPHTTRRHTSGQLKRRALLLRHSLYPSRVRHNIMMDVDSTSLPPPRLPGRVIPNNNNNNNNSATTIELSAASRSSFLAGKMLRGADVVQSKSYGKEDATTTSRNNRPVNAVGGRDNTLSHGYDAVQEAVLHVPAGRDRESPRKDQSRGHLLQIPSSKSNSQDTVMTNDVGDDIFTPAASAGGLSRTDSKSSGQDSSSQESQLQQLSQIAAAREKMPNTAGGSDGGTDQTGGQSRKRMADGMVKSASEGATVSPVLKGGHSRNTSTVSVASSAGSRLGELSAELKTRLSYAMIKVNNGWQSHTIDQVETLASQAASPTSSNSTIHFRQGASASPQISTPSYRGSNNATPVTALHQQFAPRLSDTRNPVPNNPPSSSTAMKQQPTLAPPISIEPSQHMSNPRRTANQRHTPTIAGQSLASPSTAPHTPGQPSPYPGSQEQRTPQVDPMIFSPHQTPQQNVREQDAMEALLFMSSPGNSANLKHTFPSSSQPVNRGSRTALPGSQPRKSLPSGRPVANPVPHPYGPSKAGQLQAAQPKRVGFEPAGTTAANNLAPYTSPYPAAPSATRKSNATDPRAPESRNATTARLKRLPLSAGLSGPSIPRPKLADADIDRMLDSVAAEDSSDSEGEIIIPARPQHRREEIPAAAR
ncbi:hypothetical protein GE09DRAFT_619718 [Coniochaeta sp. 2T2.1]|nr:hypothetical protein GE09DRAFT_619718 [Coniochaeta sp. 2T2.1]